MSKRLLVLAVIFLGATSFSQTKGWEKEPMTVFGIPLGEAIPAGKVPACQLSSKENGYKQPSDPCIAFSRLDPDFGELMGLPFPSIAHRGSIHFHDGLVSKIIIDLSHDGYRQMRLILVERYGEPAKIEHSTVTSRAGATFDTEELSWVGVKNSVSLSERVDRIDRSIVIFSNNERSQIEYKKFRNTAKDAASKL